MKTVHVPFGYFPDPVGGTEVYVAALARALQRQGHDVVVAAPGREDTAYAHDGIRVRRFRVDDCVADVADLYGDGDADAAARFDRILDDERPDVVHLHAFTRACSVALVRKAHGRHIPVVFTYHTPTVSCLRGTLMLWGQSPCDGVMETVRCAACTLEGRGVPRPFAQLLGRMPTALGAKVPGVFGRAATAFRFPALTAMRHGATRALFAEADRIVAFRGWIAELLAANGVAPRKIVRSHHAIESVQRPTKARPANHDGLRVAFLGRLDPTKGVDVLIRAIRQIPENVKVHVSVHGTVQGPAGERELTRLRTLAGSDSRIAFHPPVDAAHVVETMARHDVVAIPSQWMETGPLVALEAFAAGVPVVGSQLGGIAELVVDGVNGRLVRDFASPEAWASALSEIALHPEWQETWRKGTEPPPTLDDVASAMVGVYRDVVAERSGTSGRIGFVA